MSYELKPIYDTRKSFYGKAYIILTTNNDIKDIKLFSYNTLVARSTTIGNITQYFYFGKYSQTTTRHQKEFFKQLGLGDKEINELFKKGVLERKCT